MRTPAEFSRVYARGGRARGPWFTIVAADNQLGHTRLGLSIGKRAWRRAVPRNRLRRLMREAFRLSYRELPPGVDLIAVGSTHEAAPSLEQARSEIVRLAHEAVERRRRRRSRDRRPRSERPVEGANAEGRGPADPR